MLRNSKPELLNVNLSMLSSCLRTDSSLSSMVTGGSQGPGVPHQAAYSITINQSQPVNNR